MKPKAPKKFADLKTSTVFTKGGLHKSRLNVDNLYPLIWPIPFALQMQSHDLPPSKAKLQ